MGKSRKEKETTELKSCSHDAHKEICDVLHETCIGNVPKSMDEQQECILVFWQHDKKEGRRGTIVEKPNVVKAKKDKLWVSRG